METAKKVFSALFGGLRFTVGGLAKTLLTLLLIVMLTGVLFMCIFAYYVKTTLTDDIDLSLEDFNVNESSRILYEDKSTGEWKELTMIQSDEKRIWIEYEQMPQDMFDAIVAIEDKRFYEHKGVDWYRTSAALVNMFITMRNDFGGSTITQQLIKNLTKQDDITVQRKLLEIFQALEFEKTYDKKEILEWYLNVVYFGEGCYGIEAAAQTYFGKPASQMTLAECASLAGITNNPSRYDPFISRANNKSRQEIILYEMYHTTESITKEEYDAAKAEELRFVRSEASEFIQDIYSYYEEVVYEDVIRDLMEQKGINKQTAKQLLLYGGYQIYSCIDIDIQNIVDSYYTDYEKLPKPWRNDSTDNFQSAMVIMDPYTGKIVALTGGTGEKKINFGLNRAINAYRSPGSAIKPIASYGPAMEYGLITPSTQVNDDADIRLNGTWWYPYNYSRENYGWTTIRNALTSSLNTVPAQIVDKLTPQVCYDFLINRLGFESLHPEDADYAPMALGQLKYGITVREMAQAFGAFPNGGTFTYGRTYSKVTDLDGNLILRNDPDTIQAFNPVVADNMTSMLRGVVTSGTGGEARIGNMPVAGKTGTTTADKDRYFVGYTPYYVAAVWTGFDHNETMYFSGNPAAKIFAKVMKDIHENLPVKNFPSGVYQAPTGIFGSEEDELELSPSPSVEPSPEVTPEVTPEGTVPTEPVVTAEPTPTPVPEVVTPAPVTPTPTPTPTPVPEVPVITPTPVPPAVEPGADNGGGEAEVAPAA